MSDPTCIRCGYSLAGLTSERCPECGDSDPSRPKQMRRLFWYSWFVAGPLALLLALFWQGTNNAIMQIGDDIIVTVIAGLVAANVALAAWFFFFRARRPAWRAINLTANIMLHGQWTLLLAGWAALLAVAYFNNLSNK